MSCFILQLTGTNDIDWTTKPISLEVDADTNPTLEDGMIDLFSGSYVDDLIYNVTLPPTELNYKILGGMLSGATYIKDRKEWNIVAIYNGEIMFVDKMYAISNEYNADGRFEVQLFKSKSWVKLASEKLLTSINILDVPFPLTHTRGWIDYVNSFGAEYVDEEFPFRYPLQIHTKFLPKYTRNGAESYPHLVESDFEPYVFALPLLVAGFKELDWSFKSPFLESSYGRRILTRIIAEDYNNRVIKASNLPLQATGGTSWHLRAGGFSTIRQKMFSTDNGQPGGVPASTSPTAGNPYWNNGVYSEAVIADVSVNFALRRDNVTKYKGDVEIVSYLGENEINGGRYAVYISDKDEFVSFALNEIFINSRDPLIFYIEIKNGTGLIRATDTWIEVTKIHKKFINIGDQYYINELFYPKDTLYDYLKGIAHMIYGKVEKNEITRTVTLYTPFDILLDEEEIEGYFKPEIGELTSIVKNTLRISQEMADYNRYLNIRFADTKEKHTLDILGDQNEENKLGTKSIYGIFVDFGDKYTKQVDVFRNEYFVPTTNEIQPTRFSELQAPMIYPFVTFEKGTFTNIGRRILFGLGEVEIDPKYNYYHWTKGGVVKPPFWAFQSVKEELIPIPESEKFIHLAFSTLKESENYEDFFPNLYDLIIKKYVISLKSSNNISVGKYMIPGEYTVFDRRKQYFFSVKDVAITGYVSKVQNYNPCDNSGAQIEIFTPDNFILDPLTNENPPDNLRPLDDFEIEVEKDGCTYIVTVDIGESEIEEDI